MKLITQPDDGLAPILKAIRNAKKTIDIVIFRFDRPELERALEGALARGVVVRALIAHTNRGGEKSLRKLELKLLAAGITVARTADDLPRYHGKILIVDDTLYVFGFNYTKLDIEKSRSFGVATTDKRLVKEAAALFEADRTRQVKDRKEDSHQGNREEREDRETGSEARRDKDRAKGRAGPQRRRRRTKASETGDAPKELTHTSGRAR